MYERWAQSYTRKNVRGYPAVPHFRPHQLVAVRAHNMSIQRPNVPTIGRIGYAVRYFIVRSSLACVLFCYSFCSFIRRRPSAVSQHVCAGTTKNTQKHVQGVLNHLPPPLSQVPVPVSLIIMSTLILYIGCHRSLRLRDTTSIEASEVGTIILVLSLLIVSYCM